MCDNIHYLSLYLQTQNIGIIFYIFVVSATKIDDNRIIFFNLKVFKDNHIKDLCEVSQFILVWKLFLVVLFQYCPQSSLLL